MAYAKLFDVSWYKRWHTDKRQMFRVIMNKYWWKTSTDEELQQWYIEALIEKESIDRARYALETISCFRKYR